MLKVSCIVYVYPRPGQSVALSARGSLLLVVTRVPGGEEETHSQLSALPLVGPQDYHVVTTELFYLPPHRGDGSELIVTTKL
jgi:hypothetical protein